MRDGIDGLLSDRDLCAFWSAISSRMLLGYRFYP